MNEMLQTTPFYVVLAFNSDSGVQSLSAQEIAKGKKFSKIFSRNPFGIKTICCGSELRSIQSADIIHDSLKVKLRVIGALSDTHTLGEGMKKALDMQTPVLLVLDGAISKKVPGISDLEKNALYIFEPGSQFPKRVDKKSI